MKFPTSPRVYGLHALCVALAGISLSSCVVPPPGPPPPPGPGPRVVVRPGPGPRPLRALPPGARRAYWRGERCWVNGGVYYRRGPGGYVVITP